MNKIRITFLLAFIAAALISFQSCNKDEGNETKISSHNSSESHKAGKNCMNCHVSGGDGEGWFTAAGTVYNSTHSSVYPGATVKLYTQANGAGTLVATVEVDKEGNFYTTEDIGFSSGLFPVIVGNSGTKHMASSTTTGQCNSCHGTSTDVLWAL